MDNPWATGPAEILDHAVWLLQRDNDTNRRIAMILTDNAVEQMIKTYLSLPKRITGVQIPRRKREEIFQNFPALLDALEEYAADKLDGIELGSIEWYHRLRNELYHEGFGLTVERDKVEIYTELANVLFRNLFGFPLPSSREDKTKLLGRFIELYNRLETGLIALASTHSLTGNRLPNLMQAARFLEEAAVLDSDEFKFIEQIRELRNKVVHGQANYKTVLKKEVVGQLEEIVRTIEEVEDLEAE